MKRWIIRIVLGGLALAVVALVALGLLAPLFRGWSLRHDLLAAAADASTIRVVEHSDRFDPPFDPRKHYEEKIFRSVTLSAEEVSRLRKAFPVSLDYSFAIQTACIFSSHHRVEFVRRDGGVTTLEICFQCDELELDGGEQRILPVGWDSSLQNFIVSLGMSPTPKEANNGMQPTAAAPASSPVYET
jgi:hypothetical protein